MHVGDPAARDKAVSAPIPPSLDPVIRTQMHISSVGSRWAMVVLLVLPLTLSLNVLQPLRQ